MRILIIFPLSIILLILGHFLIRFYMLKLRNDYITKGISNHIYHRASDILGFLEALAYALTYSLSHAEFIGLWLGLKSIGRWTKSGPESEVDYIKDLNENDKRERKNAQINIYLIGNLLVVLLGLSVGFLWKACFN